MQTMRAHRNSMAGFTLLELMIVVAIIAILAAIAGPIYSDYLKRSKLTEAYNTLAAYRVSMEQYYQDQRTYGTTGGTCGVDPGLITPSLKYFTLACTPATNATVGPGYQAYTATATGNAGTPVAGFTFYIDNNNTQKTTAEPAGWGTGTIPCWVVRKGGSCQ